MEGHEQHRHAVSQAVGLGDERRAVEEAGEARRLLARLVVDGGGEELREVLEPILALLRVLARDAVP